jgi:hypothetical protein
MKTNWEKMERAVGEIVNWIEDLVGPWILVV